MPSLRTLLILARASNLPTVWSNCLAAWWLGGAGRVWILPVLLLAASMIYIGGMFLNDAVDAEFDRQHRRERPIPSGRIGEHQVWRYSFGLLLAGALLITALSGVPPPSPRLPAHGTSTALGSAETKLGSASPELHAPANGQRTSESETASNVPPASSLSLASAPAERATTRPVITILLTAALVGFIVIYDFLHKAVTISPILMGLCRTLLFLDAASLGADGVTGLAAWSALALGAYVAGLSYFARLERMLRRPQWWPCVLLAAPLILAWIVNEGEYRRDGLLLSIILGLWIMRSLRQALGPSQQNVSRAVAGLLAGIVFVDLLAICGAPKELSFVFLGLFGLTLLFQKYFPAT